MKQLNFNEIIDEITNQLLQSDDDTVVTIYNQLFEIPIVYVGDDLWEEEFINDDILDDDMIDVSKTNTYNDCDLDESDYNDDDDDDDE